MKKRQRRPQEGLTLQLFLTGCAMTSTATAFFVPNTPTKSTLRSPEEVLFMASDDWRDDSTDSNLWRSSDEDSIPYDQQGDWENVLDRKADGSYWSSFEPLSDEEGEGDEISFSEPKGDDDTTSTLEDDAENWLNTLASISAEEVEFNMAEAERADKVRQMQEWGFEKDAIKNTFGVEVDDALETKDEMTGMKEYREMSYIEDEDLKKVESHTKVEKDPETGEPVRQQMVYVDEHTCIGCTNCATHASSTFFSKSRLWGCSM